MPCHTAPRSACCAHFLLAAHAPLTPYQAAALRMPFCLSRATSPPPTLFTFYHACLDAGCLEGVATLSLPPLYLTTSLPYSRTPITQLLLPRTCLLAPLSLSLLH